MKKPKSINELISTGGKRLSDLKVKSQSRIRALEHVRAALPLGLARAIVSAGLNHNQLTIGVASAAWAARLRYMTETLREQLSTSLGSEIRSVRIKIVPRQA